MMKNVPYNATIAHRGYLIAHTSYGETFVEKDKTLICWAKNTNDAKRQIDNLLQEVSK